MHTKELQEQQTQLEEEHEEALNRLEEYEITFNEQEGLIETMAEQIKQHEEMRKQQAAQQLTTALKQEQDSVSYTHSR